MGDLDTGIFVCTLNYVTMYSLEFASLTDIQYTLSATVTGMVMG